MSNQSDMKEAIILLESNGYEVTKLKQKFAEGMKILTPISDIPLTIIGFGWQPPKIYFNNNYNISIDDMHEYLENGACKITEYGGIYEKYAHTKL